jgi:hypothetical protein
LKGKGGKGIRQVQDKPTENGPGGKGKGKKGKGKKGHSLQSEVIEDTASAESVVMNVAEEELLVGLTAEEAGGLFPEDVVTLIKKNGRTKRVSETYHIVYLYIYIYIYVWVFSIRIRILSFSFSFSLFHRPCKYVHIHVTQPGIRWMGIVQRVGGHIDTDFDDEFDEELPVGKATVGVYLCGYM